MAQGVTERYLPGVQLFAEGVLTNLGILHEPGHKEPWMIAMDCPPSRATVLDYGARWAIEPTFSDFKSRGFDLEASQLEQAERPGAADSDHGFGDLLVCARGSRRGFASAHRARKKTQAQTDPNHWSLRKLYRSAVSWFKRGLRRLQMTCLYRPFVKL